MCHFGGTLEHRDCFPGSPSSTAFTRGRIPKWPTGADCKSAGLRLHWFESSSYHHFLISLAAGATPGEAELDSINVLLFAIFKVIFGCERSLCPTKDWRRKPKRFEILKENALPDTYGFKIAGSFPGAFGLIQ
jgi:hypothetical protein